MRIGYFLSYIYVGYFVCQLCFMFYYNCQTDQGDETDGLEREILETEGLKKLFTVSDLSKNSLDTQCHLQLHY
jgi:hypothetical protein